MTKSRITRICRIHKKQMVTFRPGVADAQDGLPGQLALKREEIILGIGIGIPRWRRGHAGLRVINIVERDADSDGSPWRSAVER